MKTINRKGLIYVLTICLITMCLNSNPVLAQTNTVSSYQSVVALESIEFAPKIETNTENTLITYSINSKLVKNNENLSLNFDCSFIKLNTNNAYNGVILSDECKLDSNNKNISNVQLIILPKSYLEKSQMLEQNNTINYLCEISFLMDGENILINEELSQTEVSIISSYSSVTENSGENYLMAISRIKRNNVQYSFIDTDTISSKNEFWTVYQESNSNLRSLSSTGNSVRNIVNDDSWFTTTGKAMKKITSSQRVCVKNSGYMGSAIYTDIIIWEYNLTEPSQSGTASIRLKMLYNTTIVYNGGTWTDYGANSSSLTLRGSTVGIKTTGTCNNDFYYQVDQSGAYNTGSNGSSPVQDILKKCFFKAVPYGDYISAGIDVMSSFVNSKIGSFNSGFGTITYDDNPSVHFNQNNGYVRSALLKAGIYNIYKDSNYQEQKVYIVKRPSQCLKTCTYQSHFEVVGFYASGFTTLYNSSISYQRSYT